MSTSQGTKEYTISAKGKKIGRLASEIAVLLQGKNEPDYAPNKVGSVAVKVTEIDGLDISEKKKEQKTYHSYSGYHGGDKAEPLSRVLEKKGPEEVLRRAVKGMLPKNKLQKLRLQNLIIEK